MTVPMLSVYLRLYGCCYDGGSGGDAVVAMAVVVPLLLPLSS